MLVTVMVVRIIVLVVVKVVTGLRSTTAEEANPRVMMTRTPSNKFLGFKMGQNAMEIRRTWNCWLADRNHFSL